MAKLKVAFVGIGGVGGFFGARLAQLDDVDVYFVQRDGKQYRGLKEGGLRLKSEPHGWDFTIQPLKLFLGSETASIGHCDCVIVCVKAYSMDETLATVAVSRPSRRTTLIIERDSLRTATAT